MSSLRIAPEMKALLERGIALQPRFADSPYNTSLGNLYYASAVFYRVVPDWAWLGWVLGVRGDLDRSLELIRAAVAISPDRVDYNVELGAILSCYGERRNADWARQEGRQTLLQAPELPIRIHQDAVDIAHVRVLLAEPDKACGYSRDGWIDPGSLDSTRARSTMGH
jgi:tetratricopeptide (TPR) repeat protein